MTVYEITPIAENHILGFRATLDAVARERKSLSFLEAPPLEQMRPVVLNNIKEGWPQLVVLAVAGVSRPGDRSQAHAVHGRRLMPLASPASS